MGAGPRTGAAAARVPWRFVLEWLVEWYDGVELWLVQLAYPLQVTLVLAVLLPVCWALARVVDRGIDGLGAKLTRVHDAEPPVGRQDGERSEKGTPA
ncbi:hypothetical protein GCM10011581_16480 [Saccharopolyspora subtropica]|uniref:Uncharacterized protein n=1 Tax=Saccharopolyspora thermophila TaxID=89367 RepID=A0A917JP73_9PSEU|nr:hypothetical protein GCM10011581_16480 [Saccharopolyspora subtropica]